MIRTILIGILGLLLAFILIAAAGWMSFYIFGHGELVGGMQSGAISNEELSRTFFERAERMTFYAEILVFPLIALVIGGFTGILTTQRPWLSALIAMAPVLVFFLLDPTVRGAILSTVYTSLAVGIATYIHARRTASS